MRKFCVGSNNTNIHFTTLQLKSDTLGLTDYVTGMDIKRVKVKGLRNKCLGREIGRGRGGGVENTLLVMVNQSESDFSLSLQSYELKVWNEIVH